MLQGLPGKETAWREEAVRGNGLSRSPTSPLRLSLQEMPFFLCPEQLSLTLGLFRLLRQEQLLCSVP